MIYIFMITFEQFLSEKEKRVKLFGLGATPSSKLVKTVNPSRPLKPIYTGMSVQKIMSVPRYDKSTGVMGS